jgi:hypothetical protein
MTVGGWIVMALSVGFVTWLLAWCLYKVATTSGTAEQIHSPADIDTRDSST